MARKKQAIGILGITLVASLTLLPSFNFTWRWNPFRRIWQAIYGLQARVTSLEESTNKTWHFVTSFTLTVDEIVSPLFFIQGEKWRIKWEPHWGDRCGWFIWDENGYADITNSNIEDMCTRNIHYVAHGEGSYYIAHYRGPDIDFTIESYH